MPMSFEELIRGKPVFVNVGVRAFGDSLRESGYEVVNVAWSPPAGGDPKLAALLDDML
jgi:FdrA protein